MWEVFFYFSCKFNLLEDGHATPNILKDTSLAKYRQAFLFESTKSLYHVQR